MWWRRPKKEEKGDAPMARAHVYITGLVQGVFFRDSTRRKASSRGVTGWVRNLADGRVEALFEGERDRVQELVDWCHRGPPGAWVEDVAVAWEEYQGEFGSFTVR